MADNTFASPYIQRPLELGFDIVVHSTTKYLNGHSDVIGGVAIVGARATPGRVRERLAFLQNAVGAIAGPFDSFLALRGLKTLALRMERHCSNALALAQWLEDAAARSRACTIRAWPSHPQHALAKRQMHGFGGMISLELKTDLAGARALPRSGAHLRAGRKPGRRREPDRAPGDHDPRHHPGETRAALGIGDGLVRLSVGVEDVDDLRDDLAQALAAI